MEAGVVTGFSPDQDSSHRLVDVLDARRDPQFTRRAVVPGDESLAGVHLDPVGILLTGRHPAAFQGHQGTSPGAGQGHQVILVLDQTTGRVGPPKAVAVGGLTLVRQRSFADERFGLGDEGLQVAEHGARQVDGMRPEIAEDAVPPPWQPGSAS